jgi:putative glycosyltransferase (TIGR04348 family)
MKIIMVTPAPPRSLYGNRVTALRWIRILEKLGHRVRLSQTYGGEPCDLLVALHARRSHDAMQAYRRRFPEAPLLLALTGTDLYRDLANSPEARLSLRMATRLVTLQPLAARELPGALRAKVRVILQSAQAPPRGVHPAKRGFPVCVVGHLRDEKDPFRTAKAARALPAASRIRILHAGKAMNAAAETRAKREMARNPRYRWLGELPRWRVRRLLARSRLMVLSSRMEGGANVISEAAAAKLPVLASHIPGSVGLLGEAYPGYFPFGDTAALRLLLLRAETDSRFLAELQGHMRRLAPLFHPARERAAWRALLAELHG